MTLASIVAQLEDGAADTDKHGGFAVANAQLAVKTAGEASDLVPLSTTTEGQRLIAGAIAACDRALADASAAMAEADAGHQLLEQAAPVVTGANPKDATRIWLAARARYDDAAAHFANVDAEAGNTGDWLNLLLARSSVDAAADAKAKVQAALDAVVAVRRFARAAVSSAMQVREMVDEGLPLLDDAPPPPPPPPAELSSLSVRAVVASVQEGDPGERVQAVAFLVAREGPVDQAASVTWTKSGTSGAADFVTATAFSGTAAWASGDDGAKRIEFLLAPDSTIEPTDTVVVTLSDPVGAKLGAAATAETAIVNDDEEEPPPPPPPPPDGTYDERLPYGGLGIGTASLLGQPGNQKVYTESSIMILCERSGTVDRISWQNRINGHGRTGYSDGDGGTIDWIARVVADPKARTIRPGPVLGQTRRIEAAATTKGWKEEYQAAGGRGEAPVIFVEIPTIRFQQPFKVKRGDMLLFTQRQTGNGAVSINNNYSTCRTFSDWSPYPLHASCRQFKAASMSTRRPEHFPLILIGYTDGVVKGTGVMGYSAGLTQDHS